MPLPLVAVVPVAAVAAYVGVRALRRATSPGRRDQQAEDALDALPEGVTLRADAASRNGTLHLRRVIQWRNGARYELDLAALGRIRLKRL